MFLREQPPTLTEQNYEQFPSHRAAMCRPIVYLSIAYYSVWSVGVSDGVRLRS